MVSQGLISAAELATGCYAKKLKRCRPRQSAAAQHFRAACRRFGTRRTRRVFLRSYIEQAVVCFAAGAEQEGRRYYDGAFMFASKRVVRQSLFKACIKAARAAYRKGNHRRVWRLVVTVRKYPPVRMTEELLYDAFAREGIITERLRDQPSRMPAFANFVLA